MARLSRNPAPSSKPSEPLRNMALPTDSSILNSKGAKSSQSKLSIDKACPTPSRRFKMSRQPKFPVPILMQGNAQELFQMNHTAKIDIQGYILGQYEAISKVGYELTKPTGTKFVFYLSCDEGDEEDWLSPDTKHGLEECINGKDEDKVMPLCAVPALCADLVVDYPDPIAAGMDNSITIPPTINEKVADDYTRPSPKAAAEDASSCEYTREARLLRTHETPSLAQPMSIADPEDFPLPENSNSDSDSVPDSNEDLENIIQKIEYTFSSLANATQGLEDSSDEDAPSAPSNNTSSVKRPSESPPDAITDIAWPNVTIRRSGFKRHNDKVSLASLIAHAQEEDFPVQDVFDPNYHLGSSFPPSQSRRVSYMLVLEPCLDPHFPGHSPCHSHDQRSCGRSAEEAIEVLRDRFEFAHYETGSAGYYRAWRAEKWETGAKMVHGSSSLRNEVVFEGDGELCSSLLPVAVDAGIRDETDLVLSSSFEENVDGSCIVLSDEPDASGSCHNYDPDFDFDEGNTMINTGIVEMSSNPSVEQVEENCRVIISTEASGVDAKNITLVRLPEIQVSHNAHREDNTETPFDYLHPNYTRFRVRKSSSKDMASNKSSIRTSLFSNQTSVTSKSSYESVRSDYSPIIDAIGVEIDTHKCQDGRAVCTTTLQGLSVASIARSATSAHHTAANPRDGKRIVSLPDVASEMRVEDEEEKSVACLSALHGADVHQKPARLQRILEVPTTPECIVLQPDDSLTHMHTEGHSDDVEVGTQMRVPLSAAEIEIVDLSSVVATDQPLHFAPPEDVVAMEGVVLMDATREQEYSTRSEHIPCQSRRHQWADKWRNRLNEVPNTAQQTTHRCIESTKKFARTVRDWVPATLGACFPF